MSPLLRHWQAAAIAVLLTAASTAAHGWYRSIEARGVAIERARIADSTLAVLRPQLARVDTLIVRDTIRVRREVTRLDTIRVAVLEHITDTLVVKEYVRQTDSVVAACSELARDCAAYRRIAAATIAALEQKLAVQPVVITRSCTTTNAVWGVAGAVTGYVARSLTHR